MMTTAFVFVGAMLLAGALGFVWGQKRGVVLESNDSAAYAAALQRMQRRLNDAESKARRAQSDTQRARRRLR